MPRLLLDENFNHRILRGLRLRRPQIAFTLVRETEVDQQDDPTVLAWAADHQHILLTHDVNTVPGFAYQRLDQGLPMPGVVIIPKDLPIGAAIDELEVLLECSQENEFANRVIHLPL